MVHIDVFRAALISTFLRHRRLRYAATDGLGIAGNRGFFTIASFSWGSTNSGFTMRTGLAVRHLTYLRV